MAEPKDSEDRQYVIQCMTTEHFVLQTARAATIQEANQRADLFLSSVSMATVALAFVAQVTEMGGPFVLFALILLPCLYFIGLVTFVRAVQVATEDMVHARGMARIRHFYVELAPVMARYLVHSFHDDRSALLADRGFRPTRWQALMSTAGMVAVVNSAIAGVFAGLVTKTAMGSTFAIAGTIGGLMFVASVFLLERHHARAWAAAEQALPVIFPKLDARAD
jgi:hypothetical protein